ncbi:aldehyde dehydrogenase family protein (macronuclear) [Tetrahymena thermophila SB210]|uniref:Aldehyde dehydrogenase n=1 Tax=Tetrahymena thermophila (strain SB210) TaxID=312017 RepID=I7MGE1_TETTS|nr:aldehyde dehydrogenase family protein [Tetrahymena thermophila SB210]EAR85073.1 aldehyde dehydrogenase family protein [Tetrahymena thermophila SB210]|eukprot:XP_001032736.1 aldehyde dehydrogenase family protein [Tetrahymena thermophila SB210]
MVPDNPAIIDPILNNLKKTFRTGKTRDLAFRKQQLRNLLTGIKEMEDEISEAVQKDLGYQDPKVAKFLNLLPTIGDIEYILNNFESWAQKRSVDVSLVVGPGSGYIIPEPYGVTLVIGAWNYPFNTTVAPAANAIAAGNCVALKPSEMSPHNSNVMKKLFDKYLDKDCYTVIEGQVEVAKAICYKPWDHIIFTGSPQKGKLVAQAASQNLIPCTLELGGKSPTIVDKTANLNVAVARIAQGKIGNSGQTCIAPDFAIVDQDIKDQFLSSLKEAMITQISNNPETSRDYNRMINEFHTKRMESMIKTHGGQIYYGGKVDVSKKFVEPTIIVNPKLDSECMQDEIFGPIFPVIFYKNFDEVINFINDRPKPLALYYFGENKTHKDRLLNETSSGHLSFNECVMHYINNTLPFGGVGNSGSGVIHGKLGFENCSHLKPVLDKSGTLGSLNSYPLNCRYPPYTESKLKTLNFLIKNLDVYPSEVLKSRKFLSVAVLATSALAYYFNPFK